MDKQLIGSIQMHMKDMLTFGSFDIRIKLCRAIYHLPFSR